MPQNVVHVAKVDIVVELRDGLRPGARMDLTGHVAVSRHLKDHVVLIHLIGCCAHAPDVIVRLVEELLIVA